MSPSRRKSLSEHLSENLVPEDGSQSQIAALLLDVASACVTIARKVAQGGLDKGNEAAINTQINIQGEAQKELDVISNDIFISTIEQSGSARGLASEEMDYSYPIASSAAPSRLLLVFDPLDGSSNLDVHGVVGSIFSILEGPVELLEQARRVKDGDFLQKGVHQIGAGYALYGPTTMFVFAMHGEVNGFTLDADDCTFYLTHPTMKVAQESNEYSVNSANYRFWDSAAQRLVDECVAGTEGAFGKNFSLRWMASLVAEVHRILVRGGIFMYPAGGPARQGEAKLRLLYEASPVAMLMQCAGGLATDGHVDILEITPTALHQRVPLIFGSANEVMRARHYYQTHNAS